MFVLLKASLIADVLRFAQPAAVGNGQVQCLCHGMPGHIFHFKSLFNDFVMFGLEFHECIYIDVSGYTIGLQVERTSARVGMLRPNTSYDSYDKSTLQGAKGLGQQLSLT